MMLPRLRYIILLALALRVAFPVLILGLSQDINVFYDNDTIEYIEPARGLITSGQFATKGVPEIERTPGYPLLLIPGIILGHIELVTIALQIVLSCFSVFIIYKIGILLFDTHEIAVLCAALLAVEPLSIMYAGRLYSETLYATVLLIFLYFLIRYLKSGASVRHYIVRDCSGCHGLRKTYFLLYAFLDHVRAFPLGDSETIAGSQTVPACGRVLSNCNGHHCCLAGTQQNRDGVLGFFSHLGPKLIFLRWWRNLSQEERSEAALNS